MENLRYTENEIQQGIKYMIDNNSDYENLLTEIESIKELKNKLNQILEIYDVKNNERALLS